MSLFMVFPSFCFNIVSFSSLAQHKGQEAIIAISINLLVVYCESVNLIGYITRRLSADSLQL